MERSLYRVRFVHRDSKEQITETVNQTKLNAVNAAVAKYYNKRSRDFAPKELQNQIKFQIGWLRKTPGSYKITAL